MCNGALNPATSSTIIIMRNAILFILAAQLMVMSCSTSKVQPRIISTADHHEIAQFTVHDTLHDTTFITTVIRHDSNLAETKYYTTIIRNAIQSRQGEKSTRDSQKVAAMPSKSSQPATTKATKKKRPWRLLLFAAAAAAAAAIVLKWRRPFGRRG